MSGNDPTGTDPADAEPTISGDFGEPGAGVNHHGGLELYQEDGWSWGWSLLGPIFFAAIAVTGIVDGAVQSAAVLILCSVALFLSHCAMIYATRVHGRVQVSDQQVALGTGSVATEEIASVFPLSENPDRRHSTAQQPWESARLLGELSEIPRRRTAIGLELKDGSLVRIWAKHPGLAREHIIAAIH